MVERSVKGNIIFVPLQLIALDHLPALVNSNTTGRTNTRAWNIKNYNILTMG